MAYNSRSGYGYGNNRKRSSTMRFGKSASHEDGSFTSKELHSKYERSGGSGLFEAIDSGNDYWTVVFKPDGHWLGRYSKSDAIARAAKKNSEFITTSPFVGLNHGTYNAGGELVATHKIIAVAMNPDGFVPGTVVALLDDGTQVTRDLNFFDNRLKLERSDKMVPQTVDGVKYEYDWKAKIWVRAKKSREQYEDHHLG